MSGVLQNKSFTRIIFALCFCLFYSNASSAFVMMPLKFASETVAADQTLVVSDHHSHNADDHHSHHADVDHQHNHAHHEAHNCCNGGEEICSSTDAACATHCATSLIEINPFNLPVTFTAAMLVNAELMSPMSIDLDGLFRPPR